MRGMFAFSLAAILLSSVATIPVAFSDHADPANVHLEGTSTIGGVPVVINLEGTTEVTPNDDDEDDDNDDDEDDEGSVHLRITGGNVTIGSDTFNITKGRGELKNDTGTLDLKKLKAEIRDGNFKGELKIDDATVLSDGNWTDVKGRLAVKEKGTKNEIRLTFTASGNSTGVFH